MSIMHFVTILKNNEHLSYIQRLLSKKIKKLSEITNLALISEIQNSPETCDSVSYLSILYSLSVKQLRAVTVCEDHYVCIGVTIGAVGKMT